MTSSLDMIRGRSNVVTLTNSSGGALVAGDVCILNTGADESATTTTSANSVSKVYIAAESIAGGATGKFYSAGFCPLVTPSASVTRGRYLFTHTVAKQAAESATYGSGAFGVILKSGATPSVWLFGSTAQGSGGGVARSGSTTDGHLAVWDGSNADSIKDGGTGGGASAGMIIQVQSTTKTDTFTSAANATWTDITGLSVTITPASTSNKIMIMASVCGAIWRVGFNAVNLRLLRDSTPISVGDAAGSRSQATVTAAVSSTDSVQTAAIFYLDAPASVSAITYKIQFYQDTPGNPFYINRSATDTDSAVFGRYASSITVMEVMG